MNHEVKKGNLSETDITILLDKSGSMSPFWTKMKESLIAIISKAVEYDSNGVTFIHFNGIAQLLENQTVETINLWFETNEPNGSTNTLAALQEAFKKIDNDKNAGTVKPHNLIIVFTDGQPDNGQQALIAQLIRERAKSLSNDSELAISFCQVGNDESATKFLKFLDDNLSQNIGGNAEDKIFDIVDTCSYAEWTEAGPTSIMLKAFND